MCEGERLCCVVMRWAASTLRILTDPSELKEKDGSREFEHWFCQACKQEVVLQNHNAETSVHNGPRAESLIKVFGKLQGKPQVSTACFLFPHRSVRCTAMYVPSPSSTIACDVPRK